MPDGVITGQKIPSDPENSLGIINPPEGRLPVRKLSALDQGGTPRSRLRRCPLFFSGHISYSREKRKKDCSSSCTRGPVVVWPSAARGLVVFCPSTPRLLPVCLSSRGRTGKKSRSCAKPSLPLMLLADDLSRPCQGGSRSRAPAGVYWWASVVIPSSV